MINNNAMGEYRYDMSSDNRYRLSEFYRPLHGIAVTYGNEQLCRSDLTEDGMVLMELPDKIISRLDSGSAIVSPMNQIVPERTINGETRNKQIFVFDILDID